MNPIAILKRAFSSNLGTITLGERESARFAAKGFTEPVIQRYLVWRRSLIIMVVIATFASAGLTTYRNLTETEEQPALMDAVTEQLKAKAMGLLPPNAALPSLPNLPAALPNLPAALPNLPQIPGLPSAAEKEKSEEEKPAAEKPETEKPADATEKPETEKPAAAAEKPEAEKPANTAEKSAEDTEKPATAEDKDAEEKEAQTVFARFTDLLETAPLYVLATAASAALLIGNRLRMSFKVLAAGFLFGFLLPMVLGVCPWSWWGYAEPTYSITKEPLKYFQNAAEGLMEGAAYLVMLLPTVLSLVPGVLKACLRVKTLLPKSLLPGWFIVMAAPLYGLFLLVIFIAVDQITAEPLVLGAMALLVVAHFVYAFRANAFTAPLLAESDYRRMRGALRIISLVTLAAGGMLLTFVATREVMGIHVFGTDPTKSLLQPLDLAGYAMEFIARSMFVTALGADLFMRINLTAWRQSRALESSEGVEDYHRVMGALDQAAS